MDSARVRERQRYGDARIERALVELELRDVLAQAAIDHGVEAQRADLASVPFRIDAELHGDATLERRIPCRALGVAAEQLAAVRPDRALRELALGDQVARIRKQMQR